MSALGAPAAGGTVGVEEEFHLVDPDSGALTGSPEVAAEALAGAAGELVKAEIVTSQLETGTVVCRDLGELRAGILAARSAAAAAAARGGLALLPASTHPFGSWRDQELTPDERYRDIVDRWALLALQQDICGCHVHVGVPDLDTAVAVMDRSRPYLPVLLALTGSSPFHGGRDTGYESFRTQWWTRWPNAGAPERIGDGAAFRALVEGLVASGVVKDATHLYWDVRPSVRWPTLEFRLGDVCTLVDDAVLFAALVRSLVRVLAGRAAREEPVPDVRPELMRAARWRAARHGLDGELFDPVARRLVPAGQAVAALLAELEEDLRSHREWSEVRELLTGLQRRGTSAARQRRVLARTGDSRAVVAAVVQEGRAG
ncbi:carboxylate-amine ligase [Geodermatophilus africanus]|uniref:Putative glutamate--cysteine ligase 2 n=1 Tax=Geodermatophilus africanus TaxID=1137993 RepID=A0A1H3CIZ3_9ACTN|nr:glutamate--cysteine ligase [Geodermatophilus africanus]SDX53449.1 carboxylate-amine ligase [Geodermatophilus africanus]